MNKKLKGMVYRLHHLYELDKEILITKTRVSKDTLLKKGYENFIDFWINLFMKITEVKNIQA